MNEHKQSTIGISVDKKIKPLIRYIIKQYDCTLMPYASCEDNGGLCYIAFSWRYEETIQHLLNDIALDNIIVELGDYEKSQHICCIRFDKKYLKQVLNRDINYRGTIMKIKNVK